MLVLLGQGTYQAVNRGMCGVVALVAYDRYALPRDDGESEFSLTVPMAKQCLDQMQARKRASFLRGNERFVGYRRDLGFGCYPQNMLEVPVRAKDRVEVLCMRVGGCRRQNTERIYAAQLGELKLIRTNNQ